MDLERQYEKLLRYCYMKVKNRETAEDIVQETYRKFWESRSYDNIGKEEAYLYTIARNLCMDQFRRPVAEDIDEHEDIPDEYFETAGRIVDRLAIEDALEKLDSEIREIVVLRYINDISVNDVANIMGMSRFAVRRRVNEGLSILKKSLQEGEA